MIKKKIAKPTGKGAFVALAAILIITCILFAGTGRNGFVNWDDQGYVYSNPQVTGSINLKEIFTSYEWAAYYPPGPGYYHPVLILTYSLIYQVAGLDPEAFHWVSLLFHLLNITLVFILIGNLSTRNVLITAVTTALFAIHPMHTESVLWVSGLKDLLYTFFFLGGMITYLHYLDTKKRVWYFVTVILAVLSCMSKGMAVVFPFALLLIDYLRGANISFKPLINKIPFFIISGIIAVIDIGVQGGEGDTLPLFTRMMFASRNVVIYFIDVFIPMMSPLHPLPPAVPAYYYVFPIVILATATVVYIRFRETRPLIFGLIFFIINIMMVVAPHSIAITADRYSYLSYLGLFFAAAYLVNIGWEKGGSLKYILGIGACLIAIFYSYKVIERVGVWRNSGTMWSDVIKNYPESGEAYYHRGQFYQLDGRATEALADFNNAISLNPYNDKARGNRAVLHSDLGDTAAARLDFSAAIRLDSSASNLRNRGMFYSKTGHDLQSLEDFTHSLSLVKGDTTYNWKGVANHKLRRFDEAIKDFSNAIEMNPSAGEYWLNRSFSENAAGNIEKAKSDALEAIRLGANPPAGYLAHLGIQ